MNNLDPIIEEIKKIKDSSSEKLPHFAVFDFDNTCIENDIQEATLAYMCRNLLLRNGNLIEHVPKPFSEDKIIRFERDEEKTRRNSGTISSGFSEVGAETGDFRAGKGVSEHALGCSLEKEPGEYHKQVFLDYYNTLEKKDVKSAYEDIVCTLAGFTKGEIFEIAKKVIVDQGEEIGKEILFGIEIAKGIRLRGNIAELMREIEKIGVDVWVVTASSEELVEAVLTHFDLPGKCIGVRLEKEGEVLKDILIQPTSILEGKVTCIQKYIHPTTLPLFGIGDSINDLPMLEYSQIRAIVNRNNALTREAEKRGWHILNG